MAAPLLSAVDKTVCRFCSSNVSPGFRRTFGDNRNVAHRCFKCDTQTRVKLGSAAGRDVRGYEDPADDDVNLSGADCPALTDGGVR